MSKEKDALEIINDPANFKSRQEHMAPLDKDPDAGEAKVETKSNPEKKSLSRRGFLKIGGAAAAAASLGGGAAAGFAIGRSDDGYTGYNRTYQGGDMFFNREPFRVDKPAFFEPVGKVERPNWTDYLFARKFAILEFIEKGIWTPDMGLSKLPGPVGDHYRSKPRDHYDNMMLSLEKNVERQEAWDAGKHKQYAIADAYSNSFADSGMYNRYGSTVEEPNEKFYETGKPVPPDEWDYRHIWRKKPMAFKSPKHASKLIKRMAHMYGMSLVGITKFDPRFMFKGMMRGMPPGSWGDEVPSHWKSIIVFGVPMYWDSTYSAIGYSTSYDAYFRSRWAAGLLERFIQELGYPARAQFPGYHYEIMMSPYVLLAGLGEYSRAGVVMVPELGANFRPAAVITDIEFEYDKPISVRMADFCKKCKICADTCPSGAISNADEPETVIRGFKRWWLDEEKCHLQWCSGPTSDGMGCRACIGVCPYSRKNTWIHTISRELEPRDPTHLVSTGLLAMQTNFFKYPEAEEFKGEWDGGKEANYHKAPWWMRSDNFFEIEKTWKYNGME